MIGPSGDQHRRRCEVGDVEGLVDVEELVLHFDDPRTGQRLVHDVEVAPHGQRLALVGQAHHLLDDPVVRDAEAQGEAPLADGLVGEGLLGQHHRMARLQRHDGGADLDA
jgi:hypothetical protein